MRLDFVLCLGLESLRVSGLMLSPIVPTMSRRLLDRLAVGSAERTWSSCSQLAWRAGLLGLTRPLSEEKVVLYRKIRD